MTDETNPERIESLLTITDGTRVVIKACLVATIYYYGGHVPERQNAVVGFVNTFQTLCGSSLRWAKHPSTFRFSSIESQKVPPLSDWLAQLQPNAGWEYELRGGDSPDDATSVSIEAVGRPYRGFSDLSYIKFSLPMTWFVSHKGSFQELLLSACSAAHPEHGYGGLGLNESPKLAIKVRYEPTVYSIALRFPGLEVDEPTSHLNFLQNGIKGGNWLTVLSDPYVQELGGLSQLENNLGNKFLIRSYQGGIIIQTGARPQMGDTEKGQIPGDYVRLAAVLKPIRVKEHGPFHHIGPDRFDREASEAWLARFDGSEK